MWVFCVFFWAVFQVDSVYFSWRCGYKEGLRWHCFGCWWEVSALFKNLNYRMQFYSTLRQNTMCYPDPCFPKSKPSIMHQNSGSTPVERIPAFSFCNPKHFKKNSCCWAEILLANATQNKFFFQSYQFHTLCIKNLWVLCKIQISFKVHLKQPRPKCLLSINSFYSVYSEVGLNRFDPGL